MNELKRLEAQRDDEIEIDLGEIFHLLQIMGDYSVLYRRWSDWVCRNKDSGDTAVLSFIDDLHFTKDKKRDIPCGYQDGFTADFGFWNPCKKPSGY